MTEIYGVTTQNIPEDNLRAGDHPFVQDSVTVLSGSGSLTRGTVLGRIDKGAASIQADAGNTGDAAIVAATLAANAQIGAYKVQCTAAPSSASANDATFAVFAPDGSRLVDATQGVAYTGGHLVFTVGDAIAADSVIGDLYTITVAAGSGKYKPYAAASLDGSAMPRAILARDVDATSADAVVNVYIHGEFNEASLAGIDAAGKKLLKDLGIFVKTVK